MGNKKLSTIPETESDEVIKSSVEDLVPILSESEDTSGNDSECVLPSCDDFSPINVFEEKSMTFSNPLFNSNDGFTSSDAESLSDEDVAKENVKIYSNPLFEFDDEYISSDVNSLFDEKMAFIVNSVLAYRVDLVLEKEFASFTLQPQTYSCELCRNDHHYGSNCLPRFSLQDLNLKLISDELMIEKKNELFKAMQSMFEKYHQREPAANLNTHTPEPSRRFNSICYDDDDDYDYEESTIPLNEIISQIPLSIVITTSTPVLPIEDPQEDIDCKDSYDSNLDESTFLVTHLFDSNEDEYFTPGDDIELLLHRDPSTHIMSVVSILEGFTNEPPLEENDDLFDFESKENKWKKILYDAPIDDLMTEDKIFDLGIHDQIFSPTYVNLPFEDRHYLFFTYVVRIFLPLFTYPVESPFFYPP
nr:hypothetical protein [Tanacetum cinerariifolium]